MKFFRQMGMILLLMQTANAQIAIPRGMVEPRDLEAARKEARQKREALVYIMVNTASSQEFVETALEEYNKGFRGYGPVVIVRAGVATPEIPPEVITTLEGLKGYPRLIATDPDDNKVIVSVPYLAIENREDGLKEARRTVHKYLSDKKKKPRVPPTPIPAG